MDPFTQGLLGAALPQAAYGRRVQTHAAGALGFLAGMAADLDVFIRSSTDPLAFLDYHRHFTHALIFIPVGGLICALALHGLIGRRWALSFRQTAIVCTFGYATHALLDAMTSYGTLLLWPFSEARIAFSIVSVIDPLFTLPLAVCVALATVKKSAKFAAVGLAWTAFYLLIAVTQQGRAVALARTVAADRGHVPVRLEAKPSFGNILLWKTIYETPEGYHIDAARVGLAPRFLEGASLPKLDVARDLPWLDPTSQQARDIARFRRFSDGFIALDPENPQRIMDVRYSFVPNELRPLWSIEISPQAAPTDHATYLTHRSAARENLGRLWRMAIGN